MQVSSILDSSISADATAVQTGKKSSTSSFASIFAHASSQASTTKAVSSDDSGFADFMRYAKETPAQRMFDTWLSSQNISMDQYNAMSSAEKGKITQEFEQYMKEKMKSEITGGANGTATVASA